LDAQRNSDKEKGTVRIKSQLKQKTQRGRFEIINITKKERRDFILTVPFSLSEFL